MVEREKGTGTLTKAEAVSWAYPRRPAEESIARYFTKEALEYVPSETDIFITNSKGDQ